MGLFSKNKGKKEPEPEPVAEEPVKKAAPAKKATPKPAAKPAAKPAPKPPSQPKDETPKPAPGKTEEKATGSYFVSPHPDGGWQVKKAKAQKALKRFKTKAEAEAYAKQVAKNQGTKVVRQKKDGKIQKEKY